MKPEAKHLFITIACYAIYIVAAVIMDEAYPSGPCTPGPGFGMIILLLPIGIIAFLASAVMMYLGRKNVKWSIWFHLLFPVAFFLFGAFAM